MRRKCEIVEKVEILIASGNDKIVFENPENTTIPVEIISCEPEDFHSRLFLTTASGAHLMEMGGRKDLAVIRRGDLCFP